MPRYQRKSNSLENRVSLEWKSLRSRQPCSDTQFLTEKHVSRTGIRDGGCGSCSDTPFREKKPVSRAWGRGKRQMRCSDTPFREEKPVSRAWGGREKTNRGHTAQRPTASYDQHTTTLYNKKLLPRNRRKSFIDMSANRLSQQSFEATRVPKRGQRRRGWRHLTP